MQVLVNGELIEIAEKASVVDLLRQLGLAGRRVAVEINGDILPRSRHAEHRISAGDRLEIVHAIGGGTADRAVNTAEELT